MDSGPAPAERPLLFVVGCSRSGTTLMARILGESSEVATLTELHFFERLWTPGPEDDVWPAARAAAIYGKLVATQAHGIIGVRGQAVAVDGGAPFEAGAYAPTDVLAQFMADEAAGRKPGSIPCDQTPRNVYYIGDILRSYPRAHVVVMQRDPRDVVASQKSKWRRYRPGRDPYLPWQEALRLWVNYHPAIVTRLWRGAMEAAEPWMGHERVTAVRFEELVTEPEATIQHVCERVGVTYNERMLNVSVTNSSFMADDERHGIDGSRKGVWRRAGVLSRAELNVTERVAGDALARAGYEPCAAEGAVLLRGLVWSLLPLKLLLALPANARRIGGLGRALKRRLATGGRTT